jgi:hypothetical protein
MCVCFFNTHSSTNDSSSGIKSGDAALREAARAARQIGARSALLVDAGLVPLLVRLELCNKPSGDQLLLGLLLFCFDSM